VRILFLCHRLPYPPNRGGKIRPFNMIRHLSRNHSVVVASLAESQAELDAGEPLRSHCAEVLVELLPPATRWRQAVAALPTSTPSSVAYFSSSRLRTRIAEAARRAPFDAVIVHCAFVAHHVDGIPAGLRVMDYGDLDSAKWAAYATHRSLPLSLGYALESRKLRAHERRLAARFDQCTVTTQGERDEFLALQVDRPCTVIPNGVDAGHFSRGTEASAAAGATSLVFLGRFDYFPNIDGARYFAEEIFSEVRRRVPGCTLQIVGANPARVVQQLGERPGVQVCANVPDVRPYLQGAAVSVAPLRIARGTQNKILESMAMGVPVVSTRQAARGIQAVPGEHLLVAEGPRDFAESVTRLLQEPGLRATLTLAAREQIARTHHWPASMSILDDVLAGRRSSAPASPQPAS
jgi:polysaccharide biosynthesis protein PslH